eukprot:288844-Amphidinium_carterae.2
MMWSDARQDIGCTSGAFPQLRSQHGNGGTMWQIPRLVGVTKSMLHQEGSRLLDSSDSSSSGPDIVETFDLIGEQVRHSTMQDVPAVLLSRLMCKDDADNPFLHWSEVLQEETCSALRATGEGA